MRFLLSVAALAAALAIILASAIALSNDMQMFAGIAINNVSYLFAPKGEIVSQVNVSAKIAPVVGGRPSPGPPAPAQQDEHWPSFNRTLKSERYSNLNQINRGTIGDLTVLCTYDTGSYAGFSTGLLEVDGALIGTTETSIFSLNAENCARNWVASENMPHRFVQGVNRGAAYLDSRLFRGTSDGRVIAYDFKSGKRLWATKIADAEKGESVSAAPIAWAGMVYVGNAGGDFKGVKGRMYALDAVTGRIIWEFYLVPKAANDPTRAVEGKSPLDQSTWKNLPGIPVTGGGTWSSYTLDPETGLLYIPGGNPAPDFAIGPREGSNLFTGSVVVLDAKTGDYRRHFKIVPRDWHDWDVSSAPSILTTAGGRKLLSVAPKDGHLYGFDLSSYALLYRKPVTRIENADTEFSTETEVRFCPGADGGAEWNGPAYDPYQNLIFIGEVEWCTTVRRQPNSDLEAVPLGRPWSGQNTINPFHTWGKQDPFAHWAGWLYATDADTGEWKWRVKSNYPVLGAVTPTAGGIVFFGDMGGNFYGLDASSGKQLWSHAFRGALAGGVISYQLKGRQKIAVATGLVHILWPTVFTTAKVSVLGLAAGQTGANSPQ